MRSSSAPTSGFTTASMRGRLWASSFDSSSEKPRFDPGGEASVERRIEWTLSCPGDCVRDAFGDPWALVCGAGWPDVGDVLF